MTISAEVKRQSKLAASNYLQLRGFSIIELNWQRPGCFIDIIASKADIVYLVEVKISPSDNYDPGLLTDSQLKRLQRSALVWVKESKWPGQWRLSSLELASPSFSVLSFTDSL